MTFEWSAEHEATRRQAADFARDHVAPIAAEIDNTARIPADVVAQAVALLRPGADLLSVVLVAEALAVASGSVALTTAGEPSPDRVPLAGLRGAPMPDRSPRAQLALAAVGLGIARAALDQALAQLRESAAHPGTDEKPHWAVADAVTEIDAARLVTYKAATSHGGEEQAAAIAMARLISAAAASRAIDVALRLSGAAAFAPGTALERLSRDGRAVALLGGGEDHQRATAADGLLPG